MMKKRGACCDLGPSPDTKDQHQHKERSHHCLEVSEVGVECFILKATEVSLSRVLPPKQFT